jgi:hypothetical protein
MHVIKGDQNGYSPGWGLEHRASNPVSVKNLTAIGTSTIVKLLRAYVLEGGGGGGGGEAAAAT